MLTIEGDNEMYTAYKSRGALKFRKRTKDYKASNVWFDPNTMHAKSYGWWDMVRRINGQVVFNDYGYSVSTRRHQSKVRSVMSDLGITPDLVIEAPKGLQDLDSAIKHYEYKVKRLEDEIGRKGSKQAKNMEREREKLHYLSMIDKVKRLMNASEETAV